jgi:SAM-dependent methyltransferase
MNATGVGMPDGPSRTWSEEAVVEGYLRRSESNARRREGEQTLLESLPDQPRRIADLGAGEGRMGALILDARPSVREMVAVDSSPAMLRRLGERFRDEPRVTIVAADLDQFAVSELGCFEVIVSGFAIHHLEDAAKRRLYAEVAEALVPGGVFANLDVVSSATPALHRRFLDEIGRPDDDPEDRLSPVDVQLGWLRECGLTDVDCLWRWRGFALVIGRKAEGSD